MALRISCFTNAPWATTGYATQAKAILPRLAAMGHQISIQASWGLAGGVVDWYGMRVYPKCLDKFGQDTFGFYAEHWGADIVLTLCDLGLIQARYLAPGSGLRVVPFFPVDHDPLPEVIRERARRAYRPLVYSRFAERVCQEAGVETVRRMTHPIDCRVFSPGDAQAARAAVGLPQDRYIVGLVGMNKYTRKAFDIQLQGFRLFQQKHPDALLYLHTYLGEHWGGIDLGALLTALGMEAPRDLMIPSQAGLMAGFVTDPEMALLYRAMDSLLLVSEGEGFGLPIVEAEACGTPVVAGDWTAMPELCYAGLTVPQSEATRVWDDRFGAWHWLARPEAIADALDQLYRAGTTPGLRARARQGALRHDADTVVPQEWGPLLAEIEADIAAEARGGALELVTF